MFFIAATLLVSSADAAGRLVRVEGPAGWLCSIAERSLSAVVANIDPGQSDEYVRRVLEVVANRLFSGFVAKEVYVAADTVLIKLAPEGKVPEWRLDFQAPELPRPPGEWFRSDLQNVGPKLEQIVQGLPLEALNWCDEGLRDEVVRAMSPDLTGWRPSIMVLNEDGATTMRISFTPEMPLVLAVTPNFSSVSLPALVHAELKDGLLERSSVFIGLPVVWAKDHAAEINLWVEEYLSDRRVVERTGSVPKVKFESSQVAHMNVEVESKRYTLAAWAAVYAGTDDRSGEIGLHLGRRFGVTDDVDGEFYGEGIMELQDWSVEGRFGLRVSPWGDVWLGGEWSTKDEMWWGKLSIDPRLHKPYAWLRIREDGEVNAALGWKATESVSFELHYDERDAGEWSLRMIGSM